MYPGRGQTVFVEPSNGSYGWGKSKYENEEDGKQGKC